MRNGGCKEARERGFLTLSFFGFSSLGSGGWMRGFGDLGGIWWDMVGGKGRWEVVDIDVRRPLSPNPCHLTYSIKPVRSLRLSGDSSVP
jgi:hypothetical protein